MPRVARNGCQRRVGLGLIVGPAVDRCRKSVFSGISLFFLETIIILDNGWKSNECVPWIPTESVRLPLPPFHQWADGSARRPDGEFD
jgi:hypothetical protein